MGVSNYEENGKCLWEIYVHVRSARNRKVRAQRRIKGFETREEADRVFKREYQRACIDVARRENEGLTWAEVIDAWDLWYLRFPSQRWDQGTVRDYCAILRNWTVEWLDKPTSSLTPTDGHILIENCKAKGASTRRLYQIKTTVNVVFKWGIHSGKILNREHSPLFGIELARRSLDSLPEILNRDQTAELLDRAERAGHEWFPLWKVDAYTGLRASELEGLRKKDIELVSRECAHELDASTAVVKNYGLIRVQRQWQKKMKRYGPTKARYWRTVPVSSQLYWYLVTYLENDFGSDEIGERVFPFLNDLRAGRQAFVLKSFCQSEGLPPIKFHTLRACFATLMLGAGVPEAQVMKIGGWKDRETMMVYVRMSGIDEAGATEALDLRPKKVPEPEVAGANVLSLFGKR